VDVTTVKGIVEMMKKRYGKSNRIWVMDRGMTSEDNLEFLRQENRRYIIGTNKALLKKFEQELLKKDWTTIRDGIEVKLCKMPKEERVRAHIFVCFLSFVLWKTLGQQCKRAVLGDEPRRVISELSEIRLVDVVLPTDNGREIRNRCVARPKEHQRILIDKLGLRLPTRIREGKM